MSKACPSKESAGFESSLFLLEVLWVLGQSHLYDVESVVVVLLSGEQQGQQVERVHVVPLELQRLPDVAQSLGDLQGFSQSGHKAPRKATLLFLSYFFFYGYNGQDFAP